MGASPQTPGLASLVFPDLRVMAHHAAQPDPGPGAQPLGREGDVVADASDGLADGCGIRRLQLRRYGLGAAHVVATQIQRDRAGYENVGFRSLGLVYRSSLSVYTRYRAFLLT